MIILSDNHSATANFIANNVREFSEIKDMPDTVQSFKKCIFGNKDISIHESNVSDYWKYQFITKYARISQFDLIKNLISENIELPNKLLCLAEKGDGFHGFRNRTWIAEKGNVHLTVFFRPEKSFPHFHTGLLTVAAVSVLKTIDSIPDLKGQAKTKWVNDIVLNNSKVCGIITQSFSTGSELSGAVIGIGLNVLSEPKFKKDIFTNSSTCLKNHSNAQECNLQSIYKQLLFNFSDCIELLNNGDYNSLLKIYRDRSIVVNKNVEIYSDPIYGKGEHIITAKVIDINENLELILENYSQPIKSGRLALLE